MFRDFIYTVYYDISSGPCVPVYRVQGVRKKKKKKMAVSFYFYSITNPLFINDNLDLQLFLRALCIKFTTYQITDFERYNLVVFDDTKVSRDGIRGVLI